MKYTTVDKIVRSVLIQKKLPLHYYLEMLKYACDCVRELYMDSMRVVNTVELEVNDYYAVDLPCDYMDWTKVGIKQGQLVQPIAQKDSINNLRNVNSSGEYVPYNQQPGANFDFPFWPGYWMFQNIDDLGENLGRLYGYNTTIQNNGFKVIPDRCQIQLSEVFSNCKIVLEYISDGQCADNASQVDPYAQACIEAYMRWRFSPNADIDRSPEAVSYVNARRIYRARKDPLTTVEIRQILFANYIGSPKN